jgi:hypothetical protein
MDMTIIYSVIILLTSPFVGYILYLTTKDEKELIKFYFPAMLWIFAVLSAIFYSINLKYAIITTYMFLAILTWYEMVLHKND